MARRSNYSKATKAQKNEASENIRHHMHHLEKHPGGRAQAIAIGLSEAGISDKPAKRSRKGRR